jgi:hypothetical protein
MHQVRSTDDQFAFAANWNVFERIGIDDTYRKPW